MPSQLNVDAIRPKTSGGAVTFPDRPYATVMFTNNTNYVLKSAGSVIDFDTILEQEGNDYSTSTYKYTAPVEGLYMVSVGVLTQNDTDKPQVEFWKNSTQMFLAYSVYRTMQASTVIHASAGDELYLKAGTAANYYEGSLGNGRYCYATYMFMG